MKKRKPYTRLIKWTDYHRNASVRLDEQGTDDKPYRAVIYFERLEDDRWLAHQEVDTFYTRENAIERCKAAVKQLSV